MLLESYIVGTVSVYTCIHSDAAVFIWTPQLIKRVVKSNVCMFRLTCGNEAVNNSLQ